MRSTAYSEIRPPQTRGGVSADAAEDVLRRDYPQLPRVARHRFVMATHLAELAATEQKLTTIRFEQSGVEYPASNVLPLFVADSVGDHRSASYFANLCIQQVRYKYVDQLNEEDARADGFSSLADLREALNHFYGALSNSSLVCIYTFKILNHPKEVNYTENPRFNSALSNL